MAGIYGSLKRMHVHSVDERFALFQFKAQAGNQRYDLYINNWYWASLFEGATFEYAIAELDKLCNNVPKNKIERANYNARLNDPQALREWL